VDELTENVKTSCGNTEPVLLVAVGGGVTMDVAKAVSICLKNQGGSAELQGWDKPTHRAVRKLAVPSISGTGAEASRTAVLINSVTGHKLGINSDYTKFDSVILDPELVRTVPDKLFFVNAMDAYLHAAEILGGQFRNALSDSFAATSIDLISEVFSEPNPRTELGHEKVMIASYLSGLALTSSYVGLVHPLSAAIGVEYRIGHTMANLISLRALKKFYPETYDQVFEWASRQNISIPTVSQLTGKNPDSEVLYEELRKHERPLVNALGTEWQKKLSLEAFSSLVESL